MVNHYPWLCGLFNVLAVWQLGINWACFHVMRTWGHLPQEPEWEYRNPAMEANDDQAI